MYWRFKLPLIIILLGVLALLCIQAGKAFKIRSEQENQPAEQQAEQPPQAQPPQFPDIQQPTADSPKALTPPKPFNVNEIPDSAENNPKPAVSQQPIVTTPPTPEIETADKPVPTPEPKPAPAPQAVTEPAPAPEATKTTEKPANVAATTAQATVTDVVVLTPAENTQPQNPPHVQATAQQQTVQNEPAIAPSSDIEGKFSQIQELIQKNDLLKARDAASAILHSPNVVEYDPVWRKAAQAISDINRIFSTTNTPCPEKQTYVIKDKDVLVRIAHNQKTTVQAIMNMNRIPDPRKIWIGQKLSYIDGDWSIKVSKSQFLLTLYRNGELYRVFKVGIGKDNRTPVGTFQIRDKVINPAWDSPEGRIPPSDPRNILGTRWMGLDATGDTSSYLTGYGIHGTTMPETVGTPSSAGCVRLKNEDVEDLFNYIPEPASAKVNVTIIE